MSSVKGEDLWLPAAVAAELAELKGRISLVSRERDEYKHLAEFLKRELERLRDLQKTPREHVDSAQVQLAFAEFAKALLEKVGAPTPPGTDDGDAGGGASQPKKKPKVTPHGRATLPEHLPVETIVLAPASISKDAIVIGEEVTWRLGFRRAGFYRLKLVRPIYVVSKDGVPEMDDTTACLYKGDLSALADAAPVPAVVADASAEDAVPGSTERAGESKPAEIAVEPAPSGVAAALASEAPHTSVASESASGSLASTTIVCARAPEEIIPRGLPTSDLLAHIFTGKFADKLPFNRQEGIFARAGVRITRGTMCGWAQHAHALARRVVDAMCADAMKYAHFIATDATGVLVQANEKCRNGHFWVFVADRDHVFFRYSRRHSKDEPKTFLAGFRGTVVADASSVYDALFRLPEGPKEAGCNSHARRYLYKALTTDRARALVGIGFYNRLFELERTFAKLPHDDRLRLRKEQSAPVVAMLKAWRDDQLASPDVAEGTPLRRALQYIKNHWDPLTRFLDDGKIPIHNNWSELQLRSLVVGRANWLFVGSDDTAAWTCTFVSLVASCQLHDLDPEAYLRDLLRILPLWPSTRVLELAPKYWRGTRARLDPAELALPIGPLTIPSRIAPTSGEQTAE